MPRSSPRHAASPLHRSWSGTPGTQRYDPMTVLSTEPSRSPPPTRGRGTNLASAFVGARVVACSSEAAGCEAENLLYESRDLVWRARRGATQARVTLRLNALGAPRLGFGVESVRSVGWRCAPGRAPASATVEASRDGDAYRVLRKLDAPDATAGEFSLWDLDAPLDVAAESHVRFTIKGDAQLSAVLCCAEPARTAAPALAGGATPPRSDGEEDADAAQARRALDATADELARKIDALRESEKRSRELFAALDRRDARADSSSSDPDATRPSSYATSATSTAFPHAPPSPSTTSSLAGPGATARTRAERDCDAAARRRREPTFPRAFWVDAPTAPAPAPWRSVVDAAGADPAVVRAARAAAPAAFDGAAVEAGLRALADRIDAFATRVERPAPASPEPPSAALEALAARVDDLAQYFERNTDAAVDAVASERPPMAPDPGSEPPAPRPPPQIAGRGAPAPAALPPPRATAVPAWSPRSTVPGLGPASDADPPPRSLPPPEMPPRRAEATAAASPRRVDPPAVEPPAPRRGPSFAAVTEALARDPVDDRDAETHLTRCILRAALRRKLRRRDRKAAELKMNEFMRATRRAARTEKA